MTDVSVPQPDFAGNPLIEDADVLAWADALCAARDLAARAARDEDESAARFFTAVRRHIEHCGTLEDVEYATMMFHHMVNRWQHPSERDHDLITAEYISGINRICKAMPYTEYLNSVYWKYRRDAALERAGHRCQLCNATARLDVHHRTYDRRGAELPEDLIVLCRSCHETFHKNGRLAR